MWRLAFDAVERPLAAASESWVQSDTFMDLAAVGFKVQRRLTEEGRRAFETWLSLWGLPTRSDVSALVNQVAALERQVRLMREQS
jgi:polyhydroxyalkanoate synthesis regulator phasin